MHNEPTEHPFLGEVTSVYTRAQVIADGVLIHAGPMAREAGFPWPVALTESAWQDCVAWKEAGHEHSLAEAKARLGLT